MLVLKSEIAHETALPDIGLHIPEIMPDEFHLGYFGRFATLSGFENEKVADAFLREGFSDGIMQSAYNLMPLKLAKLLNISPDDFVKNHTLVTLLRAAKHTEKKNHHPDVITTLGNKLAKRHASFCEKCVHEDIDYWGVSYWRRSHQLTGVGICLKHNENLCRVGTRNAIYEQPASHLRNHNFLLNDTGVKDAENPYVIKFMELINDFMDMEANINGAALSKLLANKAKQLDLRIHAEGSRKLLSDLLIEKYPPGWIELHFPSLQLKKQGEFFHEYDGALISSFSQSVTKLLLAIPVLLPDADSRILSHSGNIKPVVQPKKPVLSQNQLIESYVSNQGNINQISASLNRKSSKISAKLRLLGCPALGTVDKATLSALNAFYNGASLAEAMLTPNININVFSEILRVSGAHVKKAINFRQSL